MVQLASSVRFYARDILIYLLIHLGFALCSYVIENLSISFNCLIKTVIRISHIVKFPVFLWYHLYSEKPTPEKWPKEGAIQFDHTFLRYSKEADPVLKDLNIKVHKGWKVSIATNEAKPSQKPSWAVEIEPYN